MQEIKKIKKLSVANIVALIYALFGFIFYFSISVYALIKLLLEKNITDKLAVFISTNLGLDFLIALATALIAGIVGWIIGFIASGFYNFIAKSIGGIKVELVDVEREVTAVKFEEKKSPFARASEDKQELFKY